MLGRWTRGGRGQGRPGDGTNGTHARMAAFRRPLLAGLVLALALVGVGAVSALAGGGAPAVELERPSGLGRTDVVLNGLVNPNGAAVSECYFEYGTSEGSLSSQAQCSYSPGAGETLVPVEAAVEGLAETTTYFYRIHAKSTAGESFERRARSHDAADGSAGQHRTLQGGRSHDRHAQRVRHAERL